MNKYCSFVIIIIIIYLTYDYCSNPLVEGQRGKIDPDDDNVTVEEKCTDDAGSVLPPISSIKNGTASKPCQFKDASCKLLMDEVDADLWDGNWNKAPDMSALPNIKNQCRLCVQGSKVDGKIREVLANVGGKDHISNFALSLCDTMAIKCDSGVGYANNQQDGWKGVDCKDAYEDSTDMKKWGKGNNMNMMVCRVLSNSIIQFFLGFMGGVECTLSIKAHGLKQAIEKGVRQAAHDASGGLVDAPK